MIMPDDLTNLHLPVDFSSLLLTPATGPASMNPLPMGRFGDLAARGIAPAPPPSIPTDPFADEAWAAALLLGDSLFLPDLGASPPQANAAASATAAAAALDLGLTAWPSPVPPPPPPSALTALALALQPHPFPQALPHRPHPEPPALLVSPPSAIPPASTSASPLDLLLDALVGAPPSHPSPVVSVASRSPTPSASPSPALALAMAIEALGVASPTPPPPSMPMPLTPVPTPAQQQLNKTAEAGLFHAARNVAVLRFAGAAVAVSASRPLWPPATPDIDASPVPSPAHLLSPAPPTPTPDDPTGATFPCPDAGCTQIFPTKARLKSHRRIHRRKREFPCPACPRVLYRRQDQERHTATHLEVKPWACRRCGARKDEEKDEEGGGW
ncbi:hypothetical protein HDU96_009299 [Phlyctochytrium bullatum]|nr:hypothetical protein HDU96_009299 [Phlyctochytrium bullatum]